MNNSCGVAKLIEKKKCETDTMELRWCFDNDGGGGRFKFLARLPAFAAKKDAEPGRGAGGRGQRKNEGTGALDCACFVYEAASHQSRRMKNGRAPRAILRAFGNAVAMRNEYERLPFRLCRV